MVTQTFNGPATAYSITGLASGTLYTIRMIASNLTENSASSATISYNTILLPPTNLIATGSASTTIDISFNAPSGTVVDYVATATPTSGSVVTKTFTGTTTQITGLQSATSYTIYVIARNNSGNSLSSNSVSKSTTILPPTGLIATGSASSTIDISFNPPSGTVDYYEVTTVPPPISGTVPQRFNAPLTTYRIINLQSDTSYNIFLVAKNNSNNTSTSVSIPYYTLLSPPMDLITTGSTSSTIDISFNAPSGTVVDYMATATPTSGTVVTKTFTGTTAQIAGLQSNTAYTIYVVARNNNGNSSPSNTVSISTKISPPSNLASTGQTANTITISFTQPTGTIISYRVYAQPIPSGSVVDQSFNAPRSTYTITGLTIATEYTIYMTATNGLGTSSNSNSINATTALSTVTPTLSSGYNVYTFTSSGTITIPTTTTKTIYYLVVAGGGGGGGPFGGGGGGAGGVLQGSCTISSKNIITVTIGNGGGANANGNNSSIVFDVTTGNSKTAIGGGKGGYGNVYTSGVGGSGGGGGTSGTYSSSGSAGTSGQGYSGSNGNSGQGGGGGGGGGNALNNGTGGIGIQCTQPGITNLYSNIYWGGGGGGCGDATNFSNLGRNGGSGGGGGGASGKTGSNGIGGTGGYNSGGNASNNNGGNGANNTGSGGGGGYTGNGGSGGSGIVVIAIAV
jgi:hypothetical protein